jgi:hypothetical protein
MNSLSGHCKKYKKYEIKIYDSTSHKTIVRHEYPWLKVKSLKNELSKSMGITNMRLFFLNTEMENEKYLDDYIILCSKESIFVISSRAPD